MNVSAVPFDMALFCWLLSFHWFPVLILPSYHFRFTLHIFQISFCKYLYYGGCAICIKLLCNSTIDRIDTCYYNTGILIWWSTLSMLILQGLGCQAGHSWQNSGQELSAGQSFFQNKVLIITNNSQCSLMGMWISFCDLLPIYLLSWHLVKLEWLGC